MDRFWSKVDIRSPDQCWPWTASRRGGGRRMWYGAFRLPDRVVYAHRIAFCLGRGYPINYLLPENVVLHSCNNPICCNPAHHEIGTQYDNISQMHEQGRGWWQKPRSDVEVPV